MNDKFRLGLHFDRADFRRHDDAQEPIVVTDEMVERAAEAYEFGVMPGDESEATMDEKRSMARRVLTAAFTTGAFRQESR